MAIQSQFNSYISDYKIAEQKAEEKKKAEEAKIAKDNKIDSIFGLDDNNKGLSYLTDWCLSPFTATNNVIGSLLGGEISLTNSTDNKESTTGKGFVSSLGTLFGGLFGTLGNILKGTAGALGNAIQPQVAPQGSQQGTKGTDNSSKDSTTPQTETKSSDESKKSTDTKSSSSSGGSSSKAGSTSSTNLDMGSFTIKSMRQKDDKGEFRYQNVCVDKTGKVVEGFDTKGYEEGSTEIRSLVEEYNEASTDYDEATQELEDIDKKITEAEKEITGQNAAKQKAYAKAEGEYEGAKKTVKYLDAKLNSIQSDIEALDSKLNACEDTNSAEYKQLKSAKDALVEQQKAILEQFNKAKTDLSEKYEAKCKAAKDLSDADKKAADDLAKLHEKKAAAEGKQKAAENIMNKAKALGNGAVKKLDDEYKELDAKGKSDKAQEDKALTERLARELDTEEATAKNNIISDQKELDLTDEQKKSIKEKANNTDGSTPPRKSSETSSGQGLGAKNETGETENESETNNEGEVDKKNLEAAKKYLTAKKITIAPNATSEEIMQQAILEWSKDLKDTGNEIYTGTIKPIYTKSMDTLSELFKGIFKVKEEAEAKKPETNTEGKAAEQTLEAVKEDLDNKLYPLGKPNYVKIYEDILKKANSK